MTEAETRQHILEVAMQLMIRKGFANVSMNDIVRESQVSKGGVYWHFKSKDEIILAIFDYFLDAQLEAVQTMLHAEGTASEKLRRLFQAATIVAQEELPSPLEFYMLAVRDETLMQRTTAYFETYSQHIAALIQQGIDEGQFAPCDTTLTAKNVISFLEGVVIIGLSMMERSKFQMQFDHALNLMLNGLNKRE